jgi:hypothetical protein
LARSADNEQIAKFREDARFLLALYTNAGMDKDLGFKGNFSGYLNGHKRPSVEKIQKFYQAYGKELERYDRQIPESDVVEEGPAPLVSDFIAELRSIRDNLSIIKEMLTSHQHQRELAEIRAKLDKIEDRLSEDNPSNT